MTTIEWSWRESIRQRMDLLGYTEKYVADECDVNQSSFNKYLNGQINMSGVRLEEVCQFLGLGLVPVEDERFTLAQRVTRLEQIVWRYENGPPRPSQLKRRVGRPLKSEKTTLATE